MIMAVKSGERPHMDNRTTMDTAINKLVEDMRIGEPVMLSRQCRRNLQTGSRSQVTYLSSPIYSRILSSEISMRKDDRTGTVVYTLIQVKWPMRLFQQVWRRSMRMDTSLCAASIS